MKVSLRWLRAVAPDLDLSAEEVADRLAARGAPVEETVALAEGLDGIVVARVESVEAHPDADRLSVCRVTAAPGAEPVQVVCGAPNVRAGGLYPFAPVGSTLPGGTAIGRARIRGTASEGMLCSARELALGTDQSGLMTLPGGLEPGTPLVEALELDDRRLDVEVTANRGDLLSHVGVAREVAPDGVRSVRLPDIPGGGKPTLERVSHTREASVGGATVRVEEPELCRRYLGAVVRGVQVGPSPAWLQARLRAAGARPINNVVDATNYVLLETGQPLHAFDLDRLADHTIVVRRPRDGEDRFTTLDGEERRLGPDMLLICDAERPVAIAGVMGGLDSEVDDSTRDVLVECAWFDPPSVRATRRALVMSTDASYRFERGVDRAAMVEALERTVEIILATAGGRAEPEVADVETAPWEPRTVALRPARVERVLGVSFDEARLRELLEPLGFEAVDDAEGAGGVGHGDRALAFRVPGWRDRDVTREIDLIEEVARTWGYDAFPEALGAFRPGTVPDHPLFALEDAVRDRLVAEGLYEAQTPAFVPASDGDVRVLNPVSREEDHLRREVLPSVVRQVEQNWARGIRDVRLFEIGTSFAARPGAAPAEEPRVAAALTGRSAPVHWSGADREYDVWDLKGLLEGLVALVHDGACIEGGAPEGKGVRPDDGFTVRDAGGGVIGWAGRVTAERVDAPAWADALWGLELALPGEPAARPTPEHRPLPAFPAVERDLALIVPEALPAARVEEAIRSAAGEHLEELAMFDRYVGQGIPSGSRSLAWRMRFRSPERTLTDEDVDRATASVVDLLRRELGVEQRG